MHPATEALERQLQVRRTLRRSIESVNARATFFARSQSLRDGAYQWANDHAMLGVAQPMYWTEETTRAVAAMVPSFDLSSIICSREMLYCDIAFCWFEKPTLIVALPTYGDVDLRALTWAFAATSSKQEIILALTAYAVKDDILQPVAWSSVRDGATLNSFLWPEELSTLTPAQADKWKTQCGELFRFVICANTFLRQKIAAAEEVRLDRHARKRVVAADWQGESIVSFIQLRERERRVDDEGSEASAEGTFNWRWMVRAHTRQQFYPSLGKCLPILIGPYIKGPEDKPFKPRTQPIIVVNR